MSELQSAERNEAVKIPLAIIYRAPADLTPNPRNPRRHSKAQINQLIRSMRTFGPIVPVLTDAYGNILAGHGRVQAAMQSGIGKIPTICINHLTPEQAKAFMIADNRLSEVSSWDDRFLAEMLQDLSEAELDFDLEDTGFALDEIELRIESLGDNSAAGPDPDDQVLSALGAQAVCEAGDLWLLGQHRVMQSDATNYFGVEKLMNGKRAVMSFSDPPYNVNYGASTKDRLRGTGRPILNDNLGEGFKNFLLDACRNILSFTDGAVYVCMSSGELHTLHDAFVKAGGHWSTFLIWAKVTFTIGRSDYQRQYEPILYGWRDGIKRHWCGDRDQGDVWFVNKPVRNDLHPTMKPVELVTRALRNSSLRGDIVLDPFLGSGTSLIAAQRTGRICYGMELEPGYVDAAIRRWQSLTGEHAVHADTGKRFNDIELMKGESNGKT